MHLPRNRVRPFNDHPSFTKNLSLSESALTEKTAKQAPLYGGRYGFCYLAIGT